MKYNWAFVGCGNIAHEMAEALLAVNGEIYAVGGRTLSKTKAFAERFGIMHVYNDCTEMLRNPEVDIVYIAAPCDVHYAYMKKAVDSGKHVLCEKTFTINSRQLEEVRALAKEKGVIVMEAMTIFHMPLFQKLRELIDVGVIGKVKMLQVNFGIYRECDPAIPCFMKERGGGALLDFGVYAAAFARWFLEESPDVILTLPSYSATGVDEQSGILFKNRRGQMGVMAITMCAEHPQRAVGMISGEKGYIEVSDYPRAERAILYHAGDGRTEEITAGETEKALQYEILNMEACVAGKMKNSTLPLSGDVMDMLTDVRNQWGMVYPFE
jgi:Predicted dehydrogenases and related proteins